MQHGLACGFLAAILADPQVKPLLSDEHFSVDGTPIKAWASMESFRPKDGSGEPPAPGRNGEVDFRGEPRSNDTHASTTDPDARLYKKAAGQGAKLCHMGHALMENRNGLVVDTSLTKARARRSGRPPSRWSKRCRTTGASRRTRSAAPPFPASRYRACRPDVTFMAAAYNLVRLPKLLAGVA